MFDIYLRNLKDLLMDPIAKVFSSLKKQGITPNTFTLLSGIFGLIGVYNSSKGNHSKALTYFILNRIFDGVDGAYARQTDQCSDFGGYLDICIDFTIYGLVPIGVTMHQPSNEAWIALALLEVTFFVNAGGLFMLSALIEKNQAAKREYMLSKKTDDKIKNKKEMDKEITSVKMPPALIEGFESMVLFGLIIWFTDY